MQLFLFAYKGKKIFRNNYFAYSECLNKKVENDIKKCIVE